MKIPKKPLAVVNYRSAKRQQLPLSLISFFQIYLLGCQPSWDVVVAT